MRNAAGDFRVLPGREQVVRRAAEWIIEAGQEAIRARGRFTLALSGGSTPPPIFRYLVSPGVRGELDWARAHVFWVDERCVPPDHADSNYGMAHEELLRHVPVGSVHRMRGEDDPEEAAQAYERELSGSFGLKAGEVPRFDLLLLGMGPDGHVASLFPGADVLHEKRQLVAAPYVPKLDAWRISLTFPVLNAARHALVVVSGSGKRNAFEQMVAGTSSFDELPILGLRPDPGKLLWLADEDAAGSISGLRES